MKTRFLLPALCVAAGSLPAARAQARPELGVDVEVFRPFAGRTRDRFGSSFTGIGLGVGGVVPVVGGKLRPDFSILRQSQGGNDATIFIAGAQYRRTFSNLITETTRVVPYYGVGVNAIYGRVNVPSDNRDGSGYGLGGSVFVGTSIGSRTFVEARVRALSSVESYNFSGASLSAGVRF